MIKNKQLGNKYFMFLEWLILLDTNVGQFGETKKWNTFSLPSPELYINFMFEFPVIDLTS